MDRYRLGIFLGFIIGTAVLIRIDTRPVMTCPRGDEHDACVFSIQVEDSSDRICFREIGRSDFLACKDGEVGLYILPVKVQPPPPESGAIVFEAITIDTDRDPPRPSHPSSTLGFIPNPTAGWRNDLTLLSKRIRLRWGG